MTNSPLNPERLLGGELVRHVVRGTAFWSALCGALMLFYGVGQWISFSDSAVFGAALQVWVWTLRIGGATMLLVAALCLVGLPIALLLDAMACCLIAILLGVTGLLFVVTSGVHEVNGWLSMIFAAVFVNAGWRSWQAFAMWRTMTGRRVAHPAPSPPVALREDSGSHGALDALRRRALATNTHDVQTSHEESADGYLAALAHEDEGGEEEPAS
jgi:hypothetical protein